MHSHSRPYSRTDTPAGLIEAMFEKTGADARRVCQKEETKICAATIENDNLISCFGQRRSINYIRPYYVSGSDGGAGKVNLSFFANGAMESWNYTRGECECDPVNSKMKWEVVHAMMYEARVSKVPRVQSGSQLCE